MTLLLWALVVFVFGGIVWFSWWLAPLGDPTVPWARRCYKCESTTNHDVRSFTVGRAYVGPVARIGVHFSTDGPGVNVYLDPASARAAGELLLSTADSVDALLKPGAKGGEP